MLGERAAEIEADDGREQVGIERGDDKSVRCLPDGLGRTLEEEKTFRHLCVADDNGNFRKEDRDDFWKGDDKKYAQEGYRAACPLEMGVCVGARFFHLAETRGHRLELQGLALALRIEEHADEFEKAAEESGGA